jgi:hypothetical protein
MYSGAFASYEDTKCPCAKLLAVRRKMAMENIIHFIVLVIDKYIRNMNI